MHITELWAYCTSDLNGRETICMTKLGEATVPMLGTSLLAMQAYASAVARLDRMGQPPRLKRFSLNTSREDLSKTAHDEAMALNARLPPDHERMTDAAAELFMDGYPKRIKNVLATHL